MATTIFRSCGRLLIRNRVMIEASASFMRGS
jgi:hypothetical protein